MTRDGVKYCLKQEIVSQDLIWSRFRDTGGIRVSKVTDNNRECYVHNPVSLVLFLLVYTLSLSLLSLFHSVYAPFGGMFAVT